MTNHIALDLELEQPNDRREITDSHVDHPEIIQVGWVIFRPDPLEILKQTEYTIDIGVELSSFIKSLTGIRDEQIEYGQELDYVYQKLAEDRDHFDTSRIVKQWGHGDMEKLREEMEEKYGDETEWSFGRSGQNVKHLYRTYAEVNGLNKSGGLSKCMGRLDIPWRGRGKHQADVDALNTA